MSLAFPVILILSLLGGGADAPRPAAPPLPWLQGFPAEGIADAPSRDAETGPHAGPDPDLELECPTNAAGAFQLIADVAPPEGVETVRASYRAGIDVLDAHGRRIAGMPPFACRGSQDAIEYIAAGELPRIGSVIALAAVSGGRAERTTWLFLFVVRGDRLAPIFAAPVEEVQGLVVSAGEASLSPAGDLHHRAPDGAVTLWTYDPAAGRYVVRERLRAPPTTVIDNA